MTPDRSDAPSDPDFVLGPLALVALGAFVRAARRRKLAPMFFGVAAVAIELRWPPYVRFKLNPAVPSVLAHYPDN